MALGKERSSTSSDRQAEEVDVTSHVNDEQGLDSESGSGVAESGYPLIDSIKVTELELIETANTLPIGIFIGDTCYREIEFAEYTTAHDRMLGQLYSGPRPKLMRIVSSFLPEVVRSIGGKSLKELCKEKSTNMERFIGGMYLADFLYLVCALRIHTQGEEISMSAKCPDCGTMNADNPKKGIPNHMMGSLKVKMLNYRSASPSKPWFKVILPGSFNALGDQCNALIMEPTKAHLITKIQDSDGSQTTPTDLQILYGSVREIVGCQALEGVAGQVFSEDLYDLQSKHNVKALRDAMEKLQLGPEMAAQMDCRRCGNVWDSQIAWGDLRNFLYSFDSAV